MNARDAWFEVAAEDDPRVQVVLDAHPDGLTLEQVGDLIGVSRERARTIQLTAVSKLRADSRRVTRVVDGVVDSDLGRLAEWSDWPSDEPVNLHRRRTSHTGNPRCGVWVQPVPEGVWK